MYARPVVGDFNFRWCLATGTGILIISPSSLFGATALGNPEERFPGWRLNLGKEIVPVGNRLTELASPKQL